MLAVFHYVNIPKEIEIIEPQTFVDLFIQKTLDNYVVHQAFYDGMFSFVCSIEDDIRLLEVCSINCSRDEG